MGEGHASLAISMVSPSIVRSPRARAAFSRGGFQRIVDHVEHRRVGSEVGEADVERRIAGHAERAGVDQQVGKGRRAERRHAAGKLEIAAAGRAPSPRSG